MKKYKLLRDLPTKKQGTLFVLTPAGNLDVMKPELGDTSPFYHKETLEAYPNILKEWFEQVEDKSKTIWELEDGDDCWGLIIIDGIIKPMFLRYNSKEHTDLKDVGSLWLTLKEVQDYIEFSKAEQILKHDTKGFKPQAKECYYQAYYTVSDRRLKIVFRDGSVRYQGIKFSREEDLQKSIDNHYKEWLIYLGVEGEE